MYFFDSQILNSCDKGPTPFQGIAFRLDHILILEKETSNDLSSKEIGQKTPYKQDKPFKQFDYKNKLSNKFIEDMLLAKVNIGIRESTA